MIKSLTKLHKIFAILLFTTASLLANDGLKKYDVNLYSTSIGITNQISATTSINANEWKTWIQDNGNKWAVTLDAQTQTPMLAYGKPIAVSGFSFADESNSEAIAKKFLQENAKLFKLNPDDLELKYIKNVAGKYYVHFVQTYNGHEVLYSEVSLRINKNAQIFAFRITTYNDIDISTNPELFPNQAIAASTKDMELGKDKNGVSLLSSTKCDENLYILPKKLSTNIDYHLVYKTNFTAKGVGKFNVTIDANSGEILERKNQLHGATANVDAATSVRLRFPTDDEVEIPCSNLKIPVNGQIYYTDEHGKVDIDIDAPVTISFPVESKHARVAFEDTDDEISIIEYTLQPGENTILLNNDNSNQYERSAIYHIETIHDWILNVDPSLTCLEDVFTVTFYGEDNFGVGVNAFSSGYDIGYTLYKNNGEMELTQSADVAYHEFGHSVNTNFYQSLGTDMQNGACHEALADLTAALINDYSAIGYGTTIGSPNNVIRDLDNTNKYPEDVVGESHYDSQILSGAFWDVREELGVEYTANLSHYCRYGLPDDADIGVAYSEWFVEALIVDDDNGDLSDGTPNFDIIVESFNKHNIGLSLLASANLEFHAIDDVPASQNSANVMVNIKGDNALPIEPAASITFNYSKNNFATSQSIEIPFNEATGKYSKDIEFGDDPAIIRYYYTNTEDHSTLAYGTSKTSIDFVFAYKYDVIAENDFSSEDGISIIDADGTVNPFVLFNMDSRDESIEVTSGIEMLATNTSIAGDPYCISTDLDMDGLGGGMNLTDLLLNKGASMVVTEDFDINNKPDVVVAFLMHNFYFDQSYGFNSPQDASQTVSYALDGSDNWNLLYEFDKSILYPILSGNMVFNFAEYEQAMGKWRKFTYSLSNLDNNSIKFKFDISLDPYSNLNHGFSCSIDELTLYAPEGQGAVEDEFTANKATVYPNPVDNACYVTYYAEEAVSSNIAIYSLQGDVLFANAYYSNAGTNTIELNSIFPEMANLMSGTYFIKLTKGSQTEILPVIIR